MSLATSLGVLVGLAERHNLAQPYICGGVVRDLEFGKAGGEKLTDLNDIDITTGSADTHLLADLFAGETKENVKTFPDGHKQVVVDGVKFDFSTNFHYAKIDDLLEKAGIENPTDLQRETFSRDFTINALLMPVEGRGGDNGGFGKVLDLTGMGLEDVRRGVLRCPLDPDVSFAESPNRLVRCFGLKARFDLTFDEELRRSMVRNLDLLEKVSDRYAGEQINQALRLKPELLDELIEMGFMARLPMTRYISRLLIEKRRLLDVI